MLGGQRVKALNGTTAYVTYRGDYTALLGSREEDFPVLATSLYVRDRDAWRALLYQQTPIQRPPSVVVIAVVG